MKRIFKTAAIVVLIIVGGMAAMAQGNNKNQNISREQLAQKQAQYIADQLALDDAVSAKFISTYTDYQKEVWALGPRIENKQGATEAETEAQMKARFERSQKILELRQKYYKKYSQFLSQKQIERVYELEKQMMKRLSQKHNPSESHNKHR